MGALGLLVVRLVVGGLLAGHGAQKLFGAFGGSGIEGTTKFFGKLGLRPADTWARVGGMAELTAGSLTAAGLLSPIGPTIAFAPMTVAWAKAHRGRPIWVTEGGAELPATNLAAASALLFTGPGALSLDRLLGIRVPWWLSLAAMAATALGIAVALRDEIHEAAEAARAEEQAEEALEAGEVPAAT
jgi:putative oxidoreductase